MLSRKGMSEYMFLMVIFGVLCLAVAGVMMLLIFTGKISFQSMQAMSCMICNSVIGNWISMIPIVGDWVNPCTAIMNCPVW